MGWFNGLPKVAVNHLATGNLTVSTTSNVVTGNGTSFTTQFSNGALVVSNTNIIIGTVQSVTNSKSLILTSNSTTNLNANSFYLGSSVLTVPGILGTGAKFSLALNRVGSITAFNIIDNGQDYVSAPKVSLKVQDIIVTNIDPISRPDIGDIVYQGDNLTSATYISSIDSINVLENFIPSTNSIHQLRVYDYTSIPNSLLPLKVVNKNTSMKMVGNYTNIHNTTFDNSLDNARFDSANGIITYGNGFAEANATFLNGLVIGGGQYLDSSGQLSSSDVLQNENYNNYTYQITLSKEIEKYRDILLNLLHPSGTKVLGRIAMKSADSMDFEVLDALDTGHTLSYYTGNAATVTISAGTASNPSNNIVKFNGMYGAQLSDFITANETELVFTYGTSNNDVIHGMIVDVNNAANTVTLQDNVWTYFANVAVGTSLANGNNQVINITSLTYSYNLVNNGEYSNTDYPILDIIRVGDTITVNGVAQTVTSFITPFDTVVLSGPLSSGANGYISVGRSITSLYNQVKIIGPVGTQYMAELGTEDGDIITSETGAWLLIG